MSIRDGFLLSATTTLANQLPVSGGIVAKGFYLKRKHSLSYTKFLSATLSLFFCFVTVNGFIGVAILLYWMVFANIYVSRLLLLGFAAMAACFLVFRLPFERVKLPHKIHIWFDQGIEGWNLISKDLALVVKLVLLQTSLMLILAVRYWLAFHMLSQNVNVGETVLFSSAAVLTQLVSFAPGGLGVTEAIVAAVASALGFDMAVSVVAVGLDRLISTAVIFIVGGIGTIILGKQLSDPSAEPENPT